jgi:hypothetical protein
MDEMTTNELAQMLRAQMVGRRLTLHKACDECGLDYPATRYRLMRDGWQTRYTLVKNGRLTAR